jgi:ribonuclease Z
LTVTLERRGLVAGEWVRDLKSRVWKGRQEREVRVTRHEGERLVQETVADPAALYDAIRGDGETASLGYVSDVGWTRQNVEIMQDFFSGLTLLCSECTFLAADREKVRASHHLTTHDLNRLTSRLTPRYLLAMHLSKGYLRRTVDLYTELRLPQGTSLLRLPIHIVPPPLGVADVGSWLRPT